MAPSYCEGDSLQVMPNGVTQGYPPKQSSPTAIALCGYGVVGIGVVKILKKRYSDRFWVKWILVKDIEKKREAEFPLESSVTDQYQLISQDPDIMCVIDATNGSEDMEALLYLTLQQGKHIISANKALLSRCAHNIQAIIEDQAPMKKSNCMFEAAVCGGIPIIATINRGLSCDSISLIWGILNGTTNYILSMMQESDVDYAVALSQAQEKGYAEIDPTADVCGYDAQAKICLLAKICFKANITQDSIWVNGIPNISIDDIRWANKNGQTIKLLGIAKNQSNHVDAWITPALIPKSHKFSSVTGPENAVEIHSEYLGKTYYSGPGAGQLPTANSIVADLLDMDTRCQFLATRVNTVTPFPTDPTVHVADGSEEYSFYIRCNINENTTNINDDIENISKSYSIRFRSVQIEPKILYMITEKCSRFAIEKLVAQMDNSFSSDRTKKSFFAAIIE